MATLNTTDNLKQKEEIDKRFKEKDKEANFINFESK